jgi:hypothetical protein
MSAITFAGPARHHGRLAKIATVKSGRIVAVEPAPQAGQHRFRTVEIASLAELMAAVQDAAGRGEIACRAEPLGPTGRRAIYHHAEKGPPGMRIVPRRWAALDMDGIPIEPDRSEPIPVELLDDPAEAFLGMPDPLLDASTVGVEQCQRRLPPEFRGVDCGWQLSASAGLKAGWRMRLWFVLSAAATGDALKRRFLPCIERGYVDSVSFVEPQPIYLAVQFVGGPDPAPARFGIWRGGQGEVVQLHDLDAIARRQDERERREREQQRRLQIAPSRHDGTLDGYLQSRVDVVRAAREGNRHPTYKFESCRVEATCRKYGIAFDPWQTKLIEAYEATLSPDEIRNRQSGSIVGVQTWLAGRRS